MPGEVPKNPKVYHITHVNNLPRILAAGKLWSDRKRLDLGLDCDIVGMSSIKQRRLTELQVSCHEGSFVGEYVPFYLCPRSIMLFILHRGNHPEVTYRGGQGPIVHLEADLRRVVEWADARNRRWAFSTRNAGAYIVKFRKSLVQLDEIDWDAVAATDFRDAVVKEGKQAEFLLHESFPWHLVERVGACNQETVAAANRVIVATDHQPPVQLLPTWYY